MSVNEIDSLIKDFNAYTQAFTKITGRILSHEEWQEIKQYLASRQKLKLPTIHWEDFKAFADLFDEVHPYFIEKFHVPMLMQAMWAEYMGLLSLAELDVIRSKWRTAK